MGGRTSTVLGALPVRCLAAGGPLAKLKQSAAEWCYYRQGDDPAGTYGRLRDAGYAAVEMAHESRWAAARAAGLQVLNMPRRACRMG